MKKTNKRISTPQGAYLVLKGIDFERLKDSGLKASVYFYISGEGDRNITAIYKGVPIIETDRITLPRPKYGRIRPQQTPLHEEFENGEYPAELLFSRPGNLEFKIYANQPEEYEGIIALRDRIIPNLFDDGYNRKNIEHTSIAWLYLAKEKALDHSILHVSPSGLDIHETEIDGVKVFTQLDLDRLMQLE
jgi:hypothetical protein